MQSINFIIQSINVIFEFVRNARHIYGFSTQVIHQIYFKKTRYKSLKTCCIATDVCAHLANVTDIYRI